MKNLISLALSILILSQATAQTIEAQSPSIAFQLPSKNDPSIKFFWINPLETFSVSESKTILVKVGIQTPSALTKVSLYINERAQSTKRGDADKLDELRNIKFDDILFFNANLARGSNTIRIEVENANGGKRSETRVVRSSDAQLAFDTERYDHALLFATNDYTEWGDLVNPVSDAQAIAKELEENYGFKTEIVLNPTKSDIINKLREYSLRKYLDSDQLFVFFAGHGQFDEVFTDGYLVCTNSKKNDIARETYISFSDLRTILSNIPSNHLFLAMDVCYGGTFDQSIARGTDRSTDDLYAEVNTTEFLARKLQFKTRKYLTSGGKEYVPDGRPGEHSPFARKLLEALRTYGGRDKILTLGEIISTVEKINPEPRFGEFPGNEPGSDFLFVAK
ncbi:MAG: caspase family protein [Cyclobacteriaceae bacterium]|nr:caspase family protein [Cyclobacteriaceae bacterium]